MCKLSAENCKRSFFASMCLTKCSLMSEYNPTCSVWITGLDEAFYCFLKPQTLQTVNNICQTVINQHSQMLLPCNLLTFPQKAPCNREHLITWVNSKMLHYYHPHNPAPPPLHLMKWRWTNGSKQAESVVHLLLLSQQEIYFNTTNAYLVTAKCS